MLPRSDFLVACLKDPSRVAIAICTGESSLSGKSTSTLRPDSNATTTLLKRSLSALMATVLLLSRDTATAYKVSKVLNFCSFTLLWNLTSFFISLCVQTAVVVSDQFVLLPADLA